MTKVLIILASASALALGGCDDIGPRVVRVESAVCLEACALNAIEDLSSIDHETPPGDAIRAIHELCAATSQPCCRHGDGGPRYYRASCLEAQLASPGSAP